MDYGMETTRDIGNDDDGDDDGDNNYRIIMIIIIKVNYNNYISTLHHMGGKICMEIRVNLMILCMTKKRTLQHWSHNLPEHLEYLKCYYDQIIDIHFFTFSCTI